MPEMADPMNALASLQVAIDKGIVQLQPCSIHSDLKVLADQPTGKLRLTYANISNGKVLAISLFAFTAPIDGVPCFNVGYAVVESMRNKGLAADILAKSIEELRNGFMRNGAKKIYLEAVVAVSNTPSNKVAKKVLSDTPTQCTDAYSGQPALQYIRLIE